MRQIRLLMVMWMAVVAMQAAGQSTLSTLEGTVTDATGAVVPGASIEVAGAAVQRSVTTDENGFYRVVALPAGTYRVTASSAGFGTKVLTGVQVYLDRTVRLDIPLQVAAQAEAVTVGATLPLIDPTTSSIRQVVEARTIESIPLNGRNYLDLIQLSPGVAVNDNARTDLTSRDTRGAILGERAGNTAFLIDGLENNNDFHGGVFQAFTQDAIQEFEVILTGYKPEFGRGSAGIVNVVTKSGTNDLHGSAFFFFRNDSLDSSNVEGEEAPKLERYNYGFTLGGPVRKEKAWFFAAVEQISEARAAIFPADIPDVLRAEEDFSRQPDAQNFRAFGKYDRRLNSSNDLHFGLSFTRAKALNELAGPTSLPSNSNNSIAKTMLASLSLTSMLNPRTVLESSFSVRGQNFDQNRGESLASAGGTSFSLFLLDAGTSFDFGAPVGSIQTLHQRYFTGRETLTWYNGDHVMKFGAEYVRTQADGENGQGLLDVLVTITPFFNLFGRESFQIPQGVAFLNPGDELTRLRNNGLSFFGQDDWKLHPTFTLNYGARYDYDSKFGTHNLAPRLGFTWSPDQKTAIQASWGMFYDRYRLGIVQAVPEFGGFNGRTVVELNYPRLANDALIPFPGSLGLIAFVLADPNFLNTQFGIPPTTVVTADNIQSLTGMAPTAFLAALDTYLTGLGIPFVPVEFSPSTGYLRQDLGAGFQDEIRAVQPFKTPYNHTFTVGFQRELMTDLVAGASYVHREINHILGLRITNLDPISAIGAPITTDGGPLRRTYGPWYDGEYDGLILTASKRFSRRFQFQANYVYAKATDNLLNSNLGLGIAAQGGGAVPTDNNDLEFDRGNSDLSLAHSFVTSGLVTLPADIWVSGVFRATSGVYFTAAGTPTDYDGDGIVSTRPADTKRNQFRGPATGNLDLRVEKRFKFERFMAAGLIEFFNLTNARNPKLIDNGYVGGAPGPNFGEVRVPLPGREIQFGFRFNF